MEETGFEKKSAMKGQTSWAEEKSYSSKIFDAGDCLFWGVPIAPSFALLSAEPTLNLKME